MVADRDHEHHVGHVTERTREIGIRRALAKRRDIIRQFLVETIALSTVGGIIDLARPAGP